MAVCCLSSVPVFNEYAKDSLTVYTGSNSSNCKEIKYNQTMLLPAGKTGESFCCKLSEINVTKLFKAFNADIVFSEDINEGTCLYAYSKKIPFYKYVSGKKINLHIFLGKETCVVGTPLIFGSF